MAQLLGGVVRLRFWLTLLGFQILVTPLGSDSSVDPINGRQIGSSIATTNDGSSLPNPRVLLHETIQV